MSCFVCQKWLMSQYMLIWILAFMLCLVASKKVCPGGTHVCNDYATCCQLPDLTYGCCPLTNAVCCDDHIHCCPQNSVCNNGNCVQKELQQNTTKRGVLLISDQNTCPGGKLSCLHDFTCCETVKNKEFGCCPLQNAVCCADRKSCCPHGTICGPSSCIDNGFVSQTYGLKSVVQAKLAPLVLESKKVSNVICPGGEVQCQPGSTCCQLPSGDWGCCPYENATCCSDHLHCCPENLKCDKKSQICLQGGRNITWTKKTQLAEKIIKKDVICPDKRHCSKNMTCCEVQDKQYGCCLYSNAVCCSDHLHCCPENFLCDIEAMQCIPKNSTATVENFLESIVNL